LNDHLCVAPEQSGMELDEFLCRTFPLLSKHFLRQQVRAGRVLVNGAQVQPSLRLRADAVVSLDIDEEDAEAAPPPAPAAELVVLHEDEDVLVVDKPPDLAVEPDRWDRSRPSLIGALARLSEERARGGIVPGAGFRPRLVHRLDKDTSGAVLVAKTIQAERSLRRAFDQGEVKKDYLALVEGEHPLEDGASEEIDLAIGPDRKKSGAMCVRESGKPSRTRIRVERRFRGFTLLRCEPLTGRTHQLRVHLAAIGFPLAVDPIYGRRRSLSLSEIKSDYRKKLGQLEHPLIDRLTLHALRIEFASPSGRGRTAVEAPLPRDFERVLRQLAKVRPYR
jgi:23S rRNA pseudouridine1911/1915/1917 synthase